MKWLLAILAVSTTLLGFAQAQEPDKKPTTKPTVYVIGDSTAKNGDRLGWGDPFVSYFDPANVKVVNKASAGRSSRTYQLEGSWDKLLANLKAGDYVFIQWGHNDGGAPDKAPYRGSLPGIGDQTKEIDAQKGGGKETVHTYGWYLRKYIKDTRDKGATPILLSLTVRNEWKNGKVERGSGKFSPYTQEVAKAEKCDFIDLTNIIADKYEKLGQDTVKAFFPKDHTHTSIEGADLNASLVVAGLKGTYPDSPLVGYLSEKGKKVEAATSTATYPAMGQK